MKTFGARCEFRALLKKIYLRILPGLVEVDIRPCSPNPNFCGFFVRQALKIQKKKFFFAKQLFVLLRSVRQEFLSCLVVIR